jgi:hypothetical protein
MARCNVGEVRADTEAKAMTGRRFWAQGKLLVKRFAARKFLRQGVDYTLKSEFY